MTIAVVATDSGAAAGGSDVVVVEVLGVVGRTVGGAVESATDCSVGVTGAALSTMGALSNTGPSPPELLHQATSPTTQAMAPTVTNLRRDDRPEVAPARGGGSAAGRRGGAGAVAAGGR
jgi:hypothetical protein